MKYIFRQLLGVYFQKCYADVSALNWQLGLHNTKIYFINLAEETVLQTQ